ncbi:multidrug effflux MFS transporter [Alicyclobacillus sendaiensis]|uniref:multidrug effflux MFS transporter n=1 Tax=Alicyclobacillus sendaiensis TaxID=192387 RepID=UPI002729A0A0|nr:multidrug effflux MFS transporter [Alicyclobacillus sendaiensis]
MTLRPAMFAAWVAVFSALGPFTVDMYLSAFPDLASQLHASPAVIQLSLTMGMLGLACGQAAAGPLSDVWGRRRPLAWGMGLFTLASLGCALSPNAACFVAMRWIQGCGAGAALSIPRAMVRDEFEGLALTRLYALTSIIGSVSPLISPLVGGMVLTAAGWRGIFWFLTAVGMVLLVMARFVLPETLPRARRVSRSAGAPGTAYLAVLRDKTFTVYAVISGLYMGAIFAYVAGSPFVYETLYGLNPIVYSAVFASNGVGLMAAAQALRMLAPRVPVKRLLHGALWVGASAGLCACFTAGLHGPFPVLVGALFVLNAANGFIGPACTSLAMQNHGERAGTASAVLGILPFLFGSITSPLPGVGGARDAWPFGLTILACAALCLCLMGLGRMGRAKTAPASDASNL